MGFPPFPIRGRHHYHTMLNHRIPLLVSPYFPLDCRETTDNTHAHTHRLDCFRGRHERTNECFFQKKTINIKILLHVIFIVAVGICDRSRFGCWRRCVKLWIETANNCIICIRSLFVSLVIVSSGSLCDLVEWFLVFGH